MAVIEGMEKAGAQIILLNGPSSSGKSSLSKCLQEVLLTTNKKYAIV
ncbi:MAG: hypothetical protein K6E59_03200, partial [Bacilli bacterium]|nr:hypothetical protein [Bacilli bacterium]